MENQSNRRQEEARQPERKRQRLGDKGEQKRQENERKKEVKRYVRELEEKLKQETLPQLQEELKRQLEEEEQLQQRETKKETIERHAGKLLEEWKLQIMPQQQQAKKISDLTLEQHDQLLSFILSTNDRNDRMLGYKVCNKLRIVDIIDSMESFVCQTYKMKIKEIGEKNGNFAATERFMLLAITKKLKIGWSRQFLQVVTTMKLKDVEKLISPKQADLEEFQKRNGIPRGSLLDQLTDKLRTHCGILVSPMGKDDKDSEHVPVVHPEMAISEKHFTENTAFTDGTYKPLEEGKKAYKYAPRISFNDVTKSNVQTSDSTNKYSSVMRKHHGLFIFLIGVAGSGKSTITKRMVKTWIEENKMAFLIPFARIDANKRQSLKHLLIKFISQLHNLNHDPSEEEIDESFQWIIDNQDKCLLVLDGLDQSSFDISNQPIEDPDINDEFFPGDLISLLMSRKFLPNCRLILASRPHSLVNFAPVIQPNIVVFLNELLSNDVEKLMNYYLQQHGTAGRIMEKLRMKSPRIYQLIFTPLFLRLVVMLNNEVGEDVWTYVNTTAKLFFEVIKRLQMSAHHECGLDVNDVEILNQKVAEMAFYKTKQGSVVFEQTDLERYGLSGENVQDFLFGVLSSNTALLVGLVVVFYFNHQTTQEFFSARFAIEKLAVGEFKEFVATLFPRFEKKGRCYQVGEDSFAMLRVLVVGCFNEIDSHQIVEAEILEKKNFFIDFFCQHLRQLFVKDATNVVKEHQKQMLADLLDFQHEGICSEIREKLKEFSFWLDYRKRSTLDVTAQGFYRFLDHFVSKVAFDISKWKDDEVRYFFQNVQQDSFKKEEMRIKMWHKQVDPNELIAIFPHLTRKLELELYGGDDDQRFCRKFMKEIINFDTSKLQTQKLKVEVVNRFTTILEVVIRRCEPPQFIKVNIRGYNEDEVREFFQTIQRSSTTNEEMEIVIDAQQHQCMNELVATFPHLTRMLKLSLWRRDDDDRQQFCKKLKEAIINFDTSKLQTQELRVWVGWYKTYGDLLTIFEVVIRRCEPPQFINEDFN